MSNVCVDSHIGICRRCGDEDVELTMICDGYAVCGMCVGLYDEEKLITNTPGSCANSRGGA